MIPTSLLLLATATASLAQTQPFPVLRRQDQSPYRNTSSSTACTPIHYIVVRASTEPVGQGVIGTLATLSSSRFPGSNVEAITYPALLSPYAESSYNGTLELTRRLKDYVDTCSNAKIILLGYSQGAHIVGDVLCGGGVDQLLGPASPPVESRYAEKVVAVVQMGDPRFVLNKTFDVGSAMKGGLFPRPQNISCDAFKEKIQSYCDADDPFCSNGGDIQVHRTYTQRYNDAADEFIMKRLIDAGVQMGADPGNTRTNAAGQLHSELGFLLLTVASVMYTWIL